MSRSEMGETLIEVLMAVVILSLSVVALMGALITSITSSGEQHSLVTLDTILRSYAETAKEQIQLQTTDPTFLNSCSADAASYNPITLPAGFTPSGFGTPAISSVDFLNPTTNAFTDDSAACASNGDDASVQQITVTDTAANNVNDTLSFVVTDPKYIATPVVVVSASPTAPTLGQTVVLTATVTVPSGDPPPTGAVTWTVTGPGPPITCGAAFTCTLTLPPVGSYTATASVAKDANYKASGPSAPLDFAVGSATPTVTVTSAVSTAAGVDTLTFKAVVAGPTGGPPFSETLGWTVTGPSGPLPCGTGSTPLSGTANPDTATCAVSPTVPTSMYSATAAYPAGDPNYTAVTSTPYTAAG
ncbi:MAG: hypothetical protein ABSC30_01650 [Acidimicrobiales bacterium]